MIMRTWETMFFSFAGNGKNKDNEVVNNERIRIMYDPGE